MQVIDSFLAVPKGITSVLTFGMFDGVHLGHQQIIEVVVQKARRLHITPALVTFNPHPREVLSGIKIDFILTTSQKMEKLKRLGVELVLDLPFTLELANFTREEFMEAIYEAFSPQLIYIGKNHCFGKNRLGNFTYLLEFMKDRGGEAIEVPSFILGNRPVSSTWIRDEIQKGDWNVVKKLLGDV